MNKPGTSYSFPLLFLVLSAILQVMYRGSFVSWVAKPAKCYPQLWLLNCPTNKTNRPSHSCPSFSGGLKFTTLRCTRVFAAECARGNGGKGIFVSCPLTHHPHSPKRGVILCHKSLRSLNHTPDTLLPFLITVLSLHLYSIREINGTGYSTQVDILLWGTWLKCHGMRRTGCERMSREAHLCWTQWWSQRKDTFFLFMGSPVVASGDIYIIHPTPIIKDLNLFLIQDILWMLMH